MRANKCDRCGKLFEREQISVPDIRIEHYVHPYGGNWLDLCPDCQRELENWLNNKSFNRIRFSGDR